MKTCADLLADAVQRVREIQPWDLLEALRREPPPLVLDVREPGELAQARIPGSINVPRGVLEQACEWDHQETLTALLTRKMGPIRTRRPRASPIAFANERGRTFVATSPPDSLRRAARRNTVALRTAPARPRGVLM